MNIKVIFFIAAAALSLPVSAGFVDTDVSVVGDKKATLHEETGLE
jgi:hypothetical protein